MALKGVLTRDGCADVFQLLGRQNKSGLLKLRSGENAAVDIWLQVGHVVRAENKSRDPKQRLGTLLVRAGLLSEEQLTDALAHQRKTGKRLGHVLVEGAYVPRQLLADFIRLQARETLFNAFLLKTGTWEFIGDVSTSPAPELGGGMRWEHALMEGMRRLGEWPNIRKIISGNDLCFNTVKPLIDAPPPEPELEEEFDFGGLGDDGDGASPESQPARRRDFPSDNDRLVYALVRPGCNVQRLVDQSYIGEFETCLSLWKLCAEGYLEPLEQIQEISEEDFQIDDAV